MSSDGVARSLADALALLVQFVDGRPEDATEDDDVQALEGVASVLQQVVGEDRIQIRGLLGSELSEALGLD